MNRINKNITKLCSFYVSDWHLVTMLLPYVSKKIDDNSNIITILEKSIEENIKTLVAKLKLKNTKKILEIDWNGSDLRKYSKIKEKLQKQINEVNLDNIILVNGSKEFIEKVNVNIEKCIKQCEINNIKIINFYEVTEFNTNISEILNNHDKILNTSGEKEIGEIFEGYEKNIPKKADII